jgi:hypothetical protein
MSYLVFTQVVMMPSSRGAMLLRFSSRAERDLAVNHGPIFLGGVVVDLERPEAAENRFFAGPMWRVFLSATDFPLEHWYPANIRSIIAVVGYVAEIDLLCLLGHDFNSLHVVLELTDLERVPRELHIVGADGEGTITRLTSLFIWQHAEALDQFGVPIPFFGSPPPPLQLRSRRPPSSGRPHRHCRKGPTVAAHSSISPTTMGRKGGQLPLSPSMPGFDSFFYGPIRASCSLLSPSY